MSLSENNLICPTSQSLAEFLHGKIAADRIDWFQEHLAACDPCLETINNLNLADTFNDLTREALISMPADGTRQDQQVAENLVAQLQQLGRGETNFRTQLTRSQTLQIAQDRAAEVERLLEPATHAGDSGHLSHYRIVSLLGAGSTGVVYQAIDEQLQRPVALKILRPSLGGAARERFMTEARATAAIDHSNVVTIYEVNEFDGLAFIAMQWLPGKTLEERLAANELECRPIEVFETKQIAMQIAAGLAAAHARGLIHRDIKPANIWLPDNGAPVKILDFGLVRITDESPQLTCTGLIAGTPCYMSPEQSRGEPLDGRSDLFSLGCVMYQSLTGKLPFRSDNALATLQSIQRDQPSAPHILDPTIPTELSDIVMVLLSKSARHRPASATDLIHALQSERTLWKFSTDHLTSSTHLNSTTGLIQQPTTASSISNFDRFNHGNWVAAMIGLAILGTGGYLLGTDIVRIVTDHGELVIDSKVDDIKIEILQNGDRIRVVDLATEQSIDIKSGTYELRPLSDENSIMIDRQKLTLKRGSREVVTISRQPFVAESEKATGISNETPTKFTPIDLSTYKIDAGDTLSIYVEGVLGNFEERPVIAGAPGSGLPPSIGYPMTVAADGTIRLPYVAPLSVKGLTCQEAQNFIFESFTSDRNISPDSGDESDPILRMDASVFVSLIQPRNFVPVPGQHVSSFPSIENSAVENRPAFVNPLIVENPKPAIEVIRTATPIYNGKSYFEWLEILKTDRDLRLLNEAVKGVTHLANPDQQTEVLTAIMEMARRGFELADGEEATRIDLFLRKYLAGLKADISNALLATELRDGSRFSQAIVARGVLSKRFYSSGQKERQMNDIIQIVLKYWQESDQDDESLKNAFSTFMIFFEFNGGKLKPTVETGNLAQEYVKRFIPRPYPMDNRTFVATKLWPELPGLVEDLEFVLKDLSNENMSDQRRISALSGSIGFLLGMATHLNQQDKLRLFSTLMSIPPQTVYWQNLGDTFADFLASIESVDSSQLYELESRFREFHPDANSGIGFALQKLIDRSKATVPK